MDLLFTLRNTFTTHTNVYYEDQLYRNDNIMNDIIELTTKITEEEINNVTENEKNSLHTLLSQPIQFDVNKLNPVKFSQLAINKAYEQQLELLHLLLHSNANPNFLINGKSPIETLLSQKIETPSQEEHVKKMILLLHSFHVIINEKVVFAALLYNHTKIADYLIDSFHVTFADRSPLQLQNIINDNNFDINNNDGVKRVKKGREEAKEGTLERAIIKLIKQNPNKEVIEYLYKRLELSKLEMAICLRYLDTTIVPSSYSSIEFILSHFESSEGYEKYFQYAVYRFLKSKDIKHFNLLFKYFNKKKPFMAIDNHVYPSSSIDPTMENTNKYHLFSLVRTKDQLTTLLHSFWNFHLTHIIDDTRGSLDAIVLSKALFHLPSSAVECLLDANFPVNGLFSPSPHNIPFTPLLHFLTKTTDCSCTYSNCLQNVEMLIRFGANVNFQAKNGLTPLLLAAKNHSPKLVTFLLKAKADPSLLFENNRNVLHIIAEFRKPNEFDVTPIIKYIKENNDHHLFGFDVINQQDSLMKTPLMFAVENGNEELVKHLLDIGAQTHLRDYVNRTAKKIAKSHNYSNIYEILKSVPPPLLTKRAVK